MDIPTIFGLRSSVIQIIFHPRSATSVAACVFPVCLKDADEVPIVLPLSLLSPFLLSSLVPTSNANADRRASAPASKQASRGGGNTPNSGRKSKSRSSTAGIEAGMGGEDDLLLGGGGAAGGGQGMGNGLLEAVRRNAALSTVVADWVSRGCTVCFRRRRNFFS